MKVSILTLGCKVNQSESFQIETDLCGSGWDIVNLKEKPDYCIINTCSVTSKSDYQSRQLIRRAHDSGAKIIVTGCYSELNKEVVKNFKGVSMLVENQDKMNIAQSLADKNSFTALDYGQYQKSRFFLKIQDGCNNSCSYCVIPQSRGSSRSINKEEILLKINEVSRYFNEIVLTGIHLGTYGYNLVPKVSLSDLLKDILSKSDIRRIRLSSLEVGEIDDDLLDVIQNKRICRHLHIPLQSGDDNVLRLMNRNYTSDDFRRRIAQIYEAFPGISIGTDVIAGFPGEGDKEFENTRRLLISLPLAYMHVFPYSQRPNTKAAEMKNIIDSRTKKLRCEVLRALADEKRAAYMDLQVGKDLDMLIEKVCNGNTAVGITGNYLRTSVEMTGQVPRNIAAVRITATQGNMLLGTLIDDL